MNKRISKSRYIYYLIVTLIFGGLLFLFFVILPESTIMEIDVLARRASFTLTSEMDNNEEVA